MSSQGSWENPDGAPGKKQPSKDSGAQVKFTEKCGTLRSVCSGDTD